MNISVEAAQSAVEVVEEAPVQAPIDDWALLRDVIWPQPAPFPADAN